MRVSAKKSQLIHLGDTTVDGQVTCDTTSTPTVQMYHVLYVISQLIMRKCCYYCIFGKNNVETAKGWSLIIDLQTWESMLD